jgi:hypothetical protein
MPQVKNEKLLPPLTPVIDAQSFGTVFGLGTTVGSSSGVGYNVGGGVVVGGGTANSTTYSSASLNDINTIFSRDIENISVLYGQAKGTIMVRLIEGKETKLHYWPLFLSALTIYTINLFGVPIDYSATKLQIEVTILDEKNNVVGKYTSDYRKEKSIIAMYWGYSMENAPKRSARIAFTECMKDIKRQIANDYDRLAAALE